MSKAVRSTFVALLIAFPAAASAQVGYPPGHSPYHDIPARTGLVFTSTYVAGSGGHLGLGPRDGWLFGGRLETRLTGPTDGFVGVAVGNLQRSVIDPNGPVATRTTTGVTQSVVMVDAGITVLLTGDKTWRGFAPYIGGALGITFGSTVPSDSSGYRFRAPFTTGPHIGVRWYPASNLAVRAEGRLLFWRLKYPSSFYLTPSRAPSDPAVLDPSEGTSEWTAHPTAVFALSYSFHF